MGTGSSNYFKVKSFKLITAQDIDGVSIATPLGSAMIHRDLQTILYIIYMSVVLMVA